MALRPPTPLQPSFEMNQIVRAIEMMANAIQQKNMTMAQNHQATMHHWETARSLGQPPALRIRNWFLLHICCLEKQSSGGWELNK